MNNKNDDREIKALFEVSKVLTKSFDLEGNLKAVMRILSEMLDLERGCVYLLDPQTQELYITASYGLTLEEIGKARYKIGEGIVGKVLQTRKPIFIPDISEEPLFLNKTESRTKLKGISFFSAPIMLENEAFGALTIDRIYYKQNGTVEDEFRVLNIISLLLGQFIKLWSLYKQTDYERKVLRSQLQGRYKLPAIVGESKPMQTILDQAAKVSVTDANVLILGESGTGKELLAKTIHYQSLRSSGPFVPVNCAVLPDNLLEAELFGIEKGAFTGAISSRKGRFEVANTGTIFLDEVGEIPLNLQAKLLRAIQEKTFERLGSSRTIKTDVRVIAATNKNLEEEVRQNNFRDDLYWRLNVIPIVLPALRDRKEDIPLLVNFYRQRLNKTYSKNIVIAEDAINAMVEYDWPGNIRELANCMERLVIMSDKKTIHQDDIAILQNTKSNINKAEPNNNKSYPSLTSSLDDEVEKLEKIRIEAALRDSNFVRERAARSLGLTIRKLGYRIKKYDIKI